MTKNSIYFGLLSILCISNIIAYTQRDSKVREFALSMATEAEERKERSPRSAQREGDIVRPPADLQRGFYPNDIQLTVLNETGDTLEIYLRAGGYLQDGVKVLNTGERGILAAANNRFAQCCDLFGRQVTGRWAEGHEGKWKLIKGWICQNERVTVIALPDGQLTVKDNKNQSLSSAHEVKTGGVFRIESR